jgi:nucleoside-diphosphate-sugar epimerase
VRTLLRRGGSPATIRCLVRDRARAVAGGIPEGCLHVADLTDEGSEEALAGAAAGADVVLHLAASLKAWSRAGFLAPNVDGTARLVRAVERAAPGAHFVFASSLAAAGPSVDGRGTGALPDACRPVSGYGESKRRAEMLVVGSRLRWTIVRPPVVYGAGDAATRLLLQQACAPLTAVPRRPRPLSVIHAADVVEALLLAAGVKPAGAVLPLDGPERTDTHSLLRAIAAACGRKARLVPVPIALAAAAAAACDATAALLRRPGYFNRDKVREIRACGWVADGQPARDVLGFRPAIELAAGLAAVAAAEGFGRRVTSATA